MMITYFVDNKLGGVTSLNYNLAANQSDSTVQQRVILLDLKESMMTRANLQFPVQEQILFKYTNRDNYYKVLANLHRLLGIAEGAVVVNYETEMAMLNHYASSQTIYQLVHDAYNVGLAQKYKDLVDVYICHNKIIYGELIDLLPERKDSIFYEPHGVRIPKVRRAEREGNDTLKLVFLGRMDSGKGIFDLPVINAMLRSRGVVFEWLCIGNGPGLDELKRQWNPQDKVEFISPASNEEVLSRCATGDVFVLPTKFEGSPVSLLETMSVGLVPVISKIPGGITETVTPEIGYVINMDDNGGFADAIELLYKDRQHLNHLSRACQDKISTSYDVRKTAANYHGLFLRYREFYKGKKITKTKVGARLDQPFLPNMVTRLIRTILNK